MPIELTLALFLSWLVVMTFAVLYLCLRGWTL
jgi:hypothetical protein